MTVGNPLKGVGRWLGWGVVIVFWVAGGISPEDVVLLRHQGSQHSLDDLLEIDWYLAS